MGLWRGHRWPLRIHHGQSQGRPGAQEHGHQVITSAPNKHPRAQTSTRERTGDKLRDGKGSEQEEGRGRASGAPVPAACSLDRSLTHTLTDTHTHPSPVGGAQGS